MMTAFYISSNLGTDGHLRSHNVTHHLNKCSDDDYLTVKMQCLVTFILNLHEFEARNMSQKPEKYNHGRMNLIDLFPVCRGM